WNNNHVEEEFETSFIDVLERLADPSVHGNFPNDPPAVRPISKINPVRLRPLASVKGNRSSITPRDTANLSETLVIIPCSGRKSQAPGTDNGPSILDDLSPELSER